MTDLEPASNSGRILSDAPANSSLESYSSRPVTPAQSHHQRKSSSSTSLKAKATTHLSVETPAYIAPPSLSSGRKSPYSSDIQGDSESTNGGGVGGEEEVLSLAELLRRSPIARLASPAPSSSCSINSARMRNRFLEDETISARSTDAFIENNADTRSLNPDRETSDNAQLNVNSLTKQDQVNYDQTNSDRLHRRASSEEFDSSTWTRHKKHFFVLSSAGKPIWTRYGDESRISTYMGVIQAIVSFFADMDDTIRCINAGHHKFVFMLRGPLYLVAVAKTGEPEQILRDQLSYIYNQILSVLTSTQLMKIFEQRINFDLRRLLGGTEVFLDSLAREMSRNPSFMLGAIQCVPMAREFREKIGGIMQGEKCKGLLYAILVADNKLVTLLRPRKHSVHPSDLHLLFNMVHGSNTFRTAESWTPLCLPKFNNRGFLHAYICYISQELCLLLVSTDKDRFFELSDYKNKLVENMTSTGAFENLHEAIKREHYTIADIGIPGLRHFIYKSRVNVQFTSPPFTDFYPNLDDQRRVFRLYQYTHDRIHSKTIPLKLLYHVSSTETVLGWITSSFELYAVFGPLVSKTSIVTSANALLRWIRGKEDSLFVVNPPVF
ncbi:uncharacterized protein VTP21DRAFT_9256 [Calcarisporiella thermophila]|uniref:uncharacterized protein n=1 Tax=Calcarisporiella thermophila TaxID=911321 RepID=UPI00374367FC